MSALILLTVSPLPDKSTWAATSSSHHANYVAANAVDDVFKRSSENFWHPDNEFLQPGVRTGQWLQVDAGGRVGVYRVVLVGR